MDINEPGQDRNVAALSDLFMCDGFYNMGKNLNKNDYMLFALKEAKKAFDIDEVPIGCVIVSNNKIIARGHNLREKKQLVTSHAEIEALTKANKKNKSWRLCDCEVYVTIEPCAMCLSAMIQSRIKKLYIGSLDIKNGGISKDKINCPFEVESGILEKECASIISTYFKNKRYK